jgi:hypothetical protein
MMAGPVDTGRRMTDIRALVLNCTLKPAPTESSADLIGTQVVDYKDHEESPGKTVQTNASVADNAAHLARLLKENPYPPS